ncbi:thiol-disulfide oxidoreductase LTO1 isoform X2 [Mercurialis annua]|uniref:thiol-disulfide oxidoreductase LTO1 isoform X2 n=1 Tax=Mercurialis annua TaxID=3986 RepID=UPI00215E5084|nr:thiol-disulfide oxidoreductase LTO1 isoform X2 [Mercurialis annua]
MVSFITISPLPPTLFSRTSLLPSVQPLRSLAPITQFKKALCWDWKVNCMSSGSSPPPPPPTPSDSTESESESETQSFSSDWSISTYTWCASIGTVGFLETAYLTYLKLTDSDAFCPIGGGSCGDVLNSDYAVVFGVPLPVIGFVAYGLVASLGLLLPGKSLPFGIGENYGRFILLASTASMAAASGYFLYILSSEFSGVSCSYCLLSAFLSFSLFFITLKDFGLQEIPKALGLQLCVASLVIFALNTSYGTSPAISSSLAEIDLPYVTYEITTPSSPFALSLAKHLHSIGAKMYGAFWCSHCLEQKQMFGKEASKMLDYVECFPNGYKKGIQIAKACADAKLEGFPTWVINGEVFSGDQELPELARLSGFEQNESNQPS